MEYRLGNNKKIKAYGETQELTCPKCQNDVKLSVFSNNDTRLTSELPLFKSEDIYFLVCPKCNAIYNVDNSNGKAFKKGTEFSIMQGDLKELKAFNV